MNDEAELYLQRGENGIKTEAPEVHKKTLEAFEKYLVENQLKNH